MTEVHVVVPADIDDLASPSGGNRYDRRVVQGLADHRVVAARREHAEAGQEVGVLVAVGVVQVGALGPLVDLVEADRVQHLGLLRVQVPAVQLVAVVLVRAEQGLQVGSRLPLRVMPERMRFF